MEFTVRPARPADAEAIVDFNARLAQETEHLTLDPALLALGVNAVLADPVRGRYWVAETDGRVVGQLSVTYEWSDWRNGWFWWIQSVYVLAEYRRLGVFRQLYRHVHQLAADETDVVGLRLYVENDNHAAQAVYADLGMTPIPFKILQRRPL
jgi:GNAT superfamily N-acetyltransferase